MIIAGMALSLCGGCGDPRSQPDTEVQVTVELSPAHVAAQTPSWVNGMRKPVVGPVDTCELILVPAGTPVHQVEEMELCTEELSWGRTEIDFEDQPGRSLDCWLLVTSRERELCPVGSFFVASGRTQEVAIDLTGPNAVIRTDGCTIPAASALAHRGPAGVARWQLSVTTEPAGAFLLEPDGTGESTHVGIAPLAVAWPPRTDGDILTVRHRGRHVALIPHRGQSVSVDFTMDPPVVTGGDPVTSHPPAP